MAFDGITTAALAAELDRTLAGGTVARIIQPEKDELLLTVRNEGANHLLLLSASASLPLAYLTEETKKAPLAAPNFCMLLRKHVQGGRIRSVTQPGLERAVVFEILHRNELGDLASVKLILELMGKYSNLILTDGRGVILDSIKRVPSSVSSVREVLPGRTWFIPNTEDKADPLTEDRAGFTERIAARPMKTAEALTRTYTGISPQAAEEFCFKAGVDGGAPTASLSDAALTSLADVFLSQMERVAAKDFFPNMVLTGGRPREFACYPVTSWPDAEIRTFDSPSGLIRTFYAQKSRESRIREKTANLRHQLKTLLDRTNKKAALQEKQLADTEKRDQYRIFGELLNTYGHLAEPEAKSVTVDNYYTGEKLTIPLDPAKSASKNAQHYFDRYSKLKRTAEALAPQLEETYADREQLQGCMTALDFAVTEQDVAQITSELADFGFVRRREAARGSSRAGKADRGKGKANASGKKKGAAREEKALPLRFRSSDGFLILVGRNNYQNEEVTFRWADGNDWWFHAKGIPGSHVVVKAEGRELTDRAFEEAASLAAHYSQAGRSEKAEVDYTQRKQLHKKNGGKPGFVTYHTNYSMVASTDISSLTAVE